jgi:hypothetical protein
MSGRGPFPAIRERGQERQILATIGHRSLVTVSTAMAARLEQLNDERPDEANAQRPYGTSAMLSVISGLVG